MSDAAAMSSNNNSKGGRRTVRRKKDSDDGTVSSKQSQKSAFEAAFDSFPANETASGDPFFASASTSNNPFDASLFNSEATAAAFADFGSSPGFFDAASAFDDPSPMVDETVWDTNPHESTPKLPPMLQWNIQFKLSLRKQILAEPIINPKNGYLMFIHQHQPENVYWISQLHPDSFHQVVAFPILDQPLRDKVKLKYNASILHIHKVWRIAASTSGNIAVMLDAKALESSTTMRLIIGWNQTGTLQYVLTPPSGGDFVYNIHTFTIANTSIFLAGGSPKGSCVFVSRPAIRESWSANFLTGSGQVTSMAVHGSKLVIGLTDQSITIWCYKPSTTSKRWLLPLCRLNVTEQLENLPTTPLPGTTPSSADTKPPEIGYANHFAWFQPEPSALLLLTVALDTAVVIFHVELPVVKAENGFQPLPEPTPTTVVTSTPTLYPIAAIRYASATTYSQCAWFSMGVEPCFTVLMHDADRNAKMMLYSLQIPSPSLKSKPGLLECRELYSLSIPPEEGHLPKGMLFFESSFLTFTEGNSLHSVDFGDIPMRMLGFPVVSIPPGLDSLGEPLQMDSVGDKDGVLHVYATATCDRIKKDDVFVWSKPMRRWWLCRTVAGDTKDTFVAEEENKGSFGGEIVGGAVTDVLCELQHDDLVDMVPSRIVRCKGAPVCCVLFRSSLGKQTSSQQIQKLALVNYSADKAKVDVITGKDIEFFPVDDLAETTVSGLLLSVDGASLTFFIWDAMNGLKRCTPYRPILGVEDDDFVSCERIFLHVEGSSRFSLSVQGIRIKDGRQCFLTSDPCEKSELTSSQWSKVLPNIVRGRIIWLDEKEILFTALGLQGDGLGYRYFFLATSTRVLTLSSALTLISKRECRLRHNCIAPIGSFAACFVNGDAVEYLVALDTDDGMQCGTIAALKRVRGGAFLLFLRPDRIIVYPSVQGLRGNFGLNQDQISMPLAIVRPALLLESMVANAVCAGESTEKQPNPFVRTVVEKFGRMKAALAHSESEGIGITGAGLSSKLLTLLRRNGFHDAVSWLLSGSVKFERNCNTKILPPWLPMTVKVGDSNDADMLFHILASGDSYLGEYVKSGDRSIAATLPRRSDPSSYLAEDFAETMFESGKVRESIEIFDFSGREPNDSRVFQLSMTSHDTNVSELLSSLSGSDTKIGSTEPQVPTAFAALVSSLKAGNPRRPEMSKSDIDRWMKHIAPSFQRVQQSRRSRALLFNNSALDGISKKTMPKHDKDWLTPCNESKHIWNEGPRKEKDKLLALDRIEDWLGTERPIVLGHEGANAAADRGAKTLADILNQANDDSFGADQDDLESVKEDGWVDGVGEGRSDEANLSAYFRMSDGDEDDNEWKSEGLQDISPHQNRAILVGGPEGFSLQPSTSSVDEGEAGKVKSLFDLVFESSGRGKESCLTIPANRGSSVDVGVLHDSSRQSRKKCTLEFWYYLPSIEEAADDIILARRTMGPTGNILTDICRASNTKSVLWDLVLLANGAIEFRSCGGTLLNSSSANVEEPGPSDEGGDKFYLATPGRWNHVGLVLNSIDSEIHECKASIFMKGKIVTEGLVSFVPSWMTAADFENDKTVNELMQKSHLCLCLNHSAGLRLTELRLWACERSADDIQSFLYEYLNAAEQKKKFKVKIANKNKKGSTTLGKGLGLAAPKTNGTSSRPQISLAPAAPKNTDLSLKPPPKKSSEVAAIPDASSQLKAFDSFDQIVSNNSDDLQNISTDDEHAEEEPVGTLWDTAIPLSEQVRPSAAAAIIRGPPATRHYGGNRGGLPDFSGVDRFGVGGIAICGSDKTVVFRDNEDPPALTYPIGASGAIVSDQMDDEGSEFLCCFMAKEGRMVVFELSTRTVVVELQMTTKLNFWRYLPPEAAENTLCYILVTPVGGFHWMPLEEVPRPHQVWKRGPELQGKKVVSYEEGGSNGLDGPDILSRAGLVLVTRSSDASSLEGWVIPISGDSKAQKIPGNLFGACFCQPLMEEDGPFLPTLATVTYAENAPWVNMLSVSESRQGSLTITTRLAAQMIDDEDVRDVDYEPPTMAMGTFPEALCVSLSNILVVIVRRKGLVVAYELDDTELNLIAQECVDHYVVDAVMRYSAEVGGAEIVMLLADDTNPKDGRIVSFCFRSAT